MKKTFTLFTMVLAFSLGFAQTNAKVNSKTKLLVYYFHLTERCNTCRSIEATTKKVLEENFKTELENGTILFEVFNVDLPENKSIAKKYDAYGATLALTPIVQEKETGIVDLTNFAFSKIHTEEVFISELKAKVAEYLK
jgi:hypothetical protein